METIGRAGLGDGPGRPIFFDDRLTAVLRVREETAGPQFRDAAIDGIWGRDIVEAQIEGERLAIDLGFELRMMRQSLQLRAEQERAPCALPAVIERLLADPIARKDQLTLPPIPQSEREHPDGLLQRLLQPPGFDRREQRLGVGMTGPVRRVPFVLQPLAKLLMIIDFTV